MKKDITFTLPAEAVEGANEVIILGEFNDWSPADEYKLQKQEDGSYQAIVPLEAGRSYQYRFLLDNGRWVNDYHAQYYVPVHHFYIDNCVITVDETPDQVEEKNTSAETEQPTAQTAKKEKAPKEEAGAQSESSESTSKKPATSKAAKAKPAGEKVKTKKAEKTEKAPKASKKESSKK